MVDGVEYKAFTLDEYKQLAHILVDYHLLWGYSLDLERSNASLKREIDLQEERVTLWKQQADIEKERGDFMRKLFDTEHGMRLKLEASNKMTGWIPWALVVVESIAVGAIGIAAATD